MKNVAMMRLWRTGVVDVHIDLLDLDTGFAFEVVLTFTHHSKREKAFDIIWNEHEKIQSLINWFAFFRSVKSLKGVHYDD